MPQAINVQLLLNQKKQREMNNPNFSTPNSTPRSNSCPGRIIKQVAPNTPIQGNHIRQLFPQTPEEEGKSSPICPGAPRGKKKHSLKPRAVIPFPEID